MLGGLTSDVERVLAATQSPSLTYIAFPRSWPPALGTPSAQPAPDPDVRRAARGLGALARRRPSRREPLFAPEPAHDQGRLPTDPDVAAAAEAPPVAVGPAAAHAPVVPAAEAPPAAPAVAELVAEPAAIDPRPEPPTVEPAPAPPADVEPNSPVVMSPAGFAPAEALAEPAGPEPPAAPAPTAQLAATLEPAASDPPAWRPALTPASRPQTEAAARAVEALPGQRQPEAAQRAADTGEMFRLIGGPPGEVTAVTVAPVSRFALGRHHPGPASRPAALPRPVAPSTPDPAPKLPDPPPAADAAPRDSLFRRL